MRIIAVYSLKGGVGKTSLAVTLAWAAATLSARRTLLWDLDPQAAATFLLGDDRVAPGPAGKIFSREADAATLIHPTATPRLDLLPADASLRRLDRLFEAIGKRRRLARLIARLEGGYDRILLDCPPGLSETSAQVLRSADVVIVPLVPSPLSRRALDEVVAWLDREGLRRGALLPVFNMVDRRRTMHRAALAADPDWPAVPMASAMEAMARHRVPLGAFDAGAPAAAAIASLWRGIERRLAAA